MRCIYLSIIILFLGACHSSSTRTYQSPNYVKMADEITAKTAQKIESETGMRLMGVGGGAIDHIRKLNMGFQYLGEITMEQGRELLLYCVNEYLSAINASEEIRPYLIHYPFTPKDIEIEIFIYQPNHQYVPNGALFVVNAVDGKLKYRIRRPDPEILKKIHEETYEEAVKILETEGPVNKIRKNSRSIQRV